MSKQLSLVVLMFIMTLFGFATGTVYLSAQITGITTDRDLFVTGVIVATVLPLFSAPFLLSLSDAVGRKPVIQISFAGLLIYHSILLLSNTMPLLITGMLIYGATGVGFGSFNAYVCDQTSKYRAELFAASLAAWTFGFAGASFLQNILYSLDPRLPLLAGLVVVVTGIVLTQFLLPESLSNDNKRSFDWTGANMIGSIKTLFSNRITGMLTVAIALYFLASRSTTNVQASFFMTRHAQLREIFDIVNVQQLSTVLFAILTFILILTIGKYKAVIVTLIIAMVGMIGIAYTPIELERLTLLLPLFGSVAGSIMLAMLLDEVCPNQYGRVIGGVVGFTALMDLIAFQNPTLYQYLEEASPRNLFLCAVIPAMIVLVSLIVFVSSRKIAQ